MLYQQIQQNKRKTVVLLILFSILVLAVGWAVGYFTGGDSVSGIVITAAILAFYIPITFASAKVQVLRMAGAREIQKKDNPMIFHIIEELSIAAHVPMPKVYIVDDPSPNAFAAGMRPDSSVIAFTSGLLERLNREEITAVAAHEFSHIRNYDIRLMTLCIALVSVIVIAADMGQRMFFWGGRGNKRDSQKTNPVLMIIALVLIIAAPLAARFVHLAVSRNREYLADASAVDLTRDPQGLINALTKISSDPEGMKHVKKATASMYIASPFGDGRRKVSGWLATHPPIEKRIERLRAM